MAEPVFFFRGLPQSFLGQADMPERMLDDLSALVGLSDKQCAELQKDLTDAQGFLNPKDLLATVRRVVEDAGAAEAVRRILRSIDPSEVEQFLAFLEEKCEDKDFPIDKAKIARLKQMLKELIKPYPALARFQKAERLAKITGQRLETIELICDLRPIFDEGRETVEGMMPYTRLHIVATGEDGLPKPFEVELTYQQVSDLGKKAEKAEKKLQTLHQSIKSWLPVGLPDLPLTRIPRKESGDV